MNEARQLFGKQKWESIPTNLRTIDFLFEPQEQSILVFSDAKIEGGKFRTFLMIRHRKSSPLMLFWNNSRCYEERGFFGFVWLFNCSYKRKA